jgi:hypothetical protein
VKEDFRRQAFALAARIQAADPDNVEASNVIKLPLPKDRQDGRVPTKPFLQKRDQVLGQLSNQYAALAKATAAAGKAADAVPLLEQPWYDDACRGAPAARDRRAAVRGRLGSAEKAALRRRSGASRTSCRSRRRWTTTSEGADALARVEGGGLEAVAPPHDAALAEVGPSCWRSRPRRAPSSRRSAPT